MKKNESVTKIASTDVVSVHTGQALSEVRGLLAKNSFHHLPVVSGEKLVGIISSTDFVRLEISAYGGNEKSLDAILDHQFSLEEVMQKDVQSISSKATVRDAAEILAEAPFHSLPMVDDNGNLAGMVTTTDLIRYLLAQY